MYTKEDDRKYQQTYIISRGCRAAVEGMLLQLLLSSLQPQVLVVVPHSRQVCMPLRVLGNELELILKRETIESFEEKERVRVRKREREREREREM